MRDLAPRWWETESGKILPQMKWRYKCLRTEVKSGHVFVLLQGLQMYEIDDLLSMQGRPILQSRMPVRRLAPSPRLV